MSKAQYFGNFELSPMLFVYFHLVEVELGVQGSQRLEKYLKMKGLLEKSLKTKYALKSTGESL